MIGYTLANPIPFNYYHLMNLILIFNILMLATFSGLFRNYTTVFAFAIALLVYMGLREISTALADPFGQDPLDFPVPDFMRNCFDRAVSLLLGFTRPEARMRCLRQIAECEDIEDRSLIKRCRSELFGYDGGPAKGSAVQIKWTSRSCFETADPLKNLTKWFKQSLTIDQFDNIEIPDDADKIALRQNRAQLKEQEKIVKEQNDELQKQQDEYERDYNKLVTLVLKIDDAYPHLINQGPTVAVPPSCAPSVSPSEFRKQAVSMELRREQKEIDSKKN